MKVGTLCAILFCVAAAGFVGWRVHALRTKDTPQFEIVLDPSFSHTEDCEPLVGLAEQALRTEGVSTGSTLIVLVVGNRTTADEPWQLGTYAIPTTTKALEGRAANLQRQGDLLHDIRTKCQAVHRTTVSPIFLGVKQAIADLRARGCRGTSHCKLFVDSDLEENIEPTIKNDLNRTTGEAHVLPPPIENEGIDVTLCGLAVTTGRVVDSSSRGFRGALPRTPAREDRVRETWKSLFTNSGAVNFEPYCPKP